MNLPVSTGTILHHRYRILKVLRQGRCGWIYLAEDQKRSRRIETAQLTLDPALQTVQPKVRTTFEECVLEEWLIPEEDSDENFIEYLEEVRDYVQRELFTLNELHLSQVPHYRVVFRHDRRLYLVRESIPGKAYRFLLNQRLATGKTFTESEVRELFERLLPVLGELHDRGLVHQHLTPDRIVQRQDDRFPVLVEFDVQEELQLDAMNSLDWGYAPLEQRLGERIAPDSDLYALAAIALVLLTGCEPEELYSEQSQRWMWQSFITLSPPFSRLLDRMLSPNPKRRYASATKVMQALCAGDEKKESVVSRSFGEIALALILLGLAAIAAWRMILNWQPSLPSVPNSPIALNSTEKSASDRSADPTLQDKTLQDKLLARRRKLLIRFDLFNHVVDELFYAKHPTLQNQTLDDAQQYEWNTVAELVLNKLELLSKETRMGMGDYHRATYNGWIKDLKSLNLTSRSIEVLTDAQLIDLLPDLKGQQINPRTLGQIWYAIAYDQIHDLKTNRAPKLLSAKTTIGETIETGAGKVYLAALNPGQKIRLSLKAPAGSVLLSVFPPSEDAQPILKLANEKTWKGTIEQAGIYEIVVTPIARNSVQYELKWDLQG